MGNDTNRAFRIISTTDKVLPMDDNGSSAPDFTELSCVDINAELGSYTGSGTDITDYSRKTVYIKLSSLGSANYWVETSNDNTNWYIIGSSASELVADTNVVLSYTNHYSYMRVRLEMETGSCTATITGRGN